MLRGDWFFLRCVPVAATAQTVNVLFILLALTVASLQNVKASSKFLQSRELRNEYQSRFLSAEEAPGRPSGRGGSGSQTGEAGLPKQNDKSPLPEGARLPELASQPGQPRSKAEAPAVAAAAAAPPLPDSGSEHGAGPGPGPAGVGQPKVPATSKGPAVTTGKNNTGKGKNNEKGPGAAGPAVQPGVSASPPGPTGPAGPPPAAESQGKDTGHARTETGVVPGGGPGGGPAAGGGGGSSGAGKPAAKPGPPAAAGQPGGPEKGPSETQSQSEKGPDGNKEGAGLPQKEPNGKVNAQNAGTHTQEPTNGSSPAPGPQNQSQTTTSTTSPGVQGTPSAVTPTSTAVQGITTGISQPPLMQPQTGSATAKVTAVCAPIFATMTVALCAYVVQIL